MRSLRLLLAVLVLSAVAAPGLVLARETSPKIEAIVRWTAAATPTLRATTTSAAGATELATLPTLRLTLVAGPPTVISTLERSSLVETVVANRTFWILGRGGDPLINKQWGLKRIGAPAAWAAERKAGAEVVVGILDTGIDSHHDDLKDKVVPGYDFVNGEQNPSDDNGHGTHVAGIVAASVGNGKGVAGASATAKVMPLKTCLSAGSCDMFAVFEAVVYGTLNGADVLNLSLGGAGPCDFISSTVFEWAWSQGVTTIVAAGNDAENENPSITPANCPYTYSVGATDQKNKRASFSSYGDFVDIAAPGVDIWSTLPPVLSLSTGRVGYGPSQGTSMAAPFVAGVAALVKARHPDWTPQQITDRLTETARDLGKKGRDDMFGHGLVDARRAGR